MTSFENNLTILQQMSDGVESLKVIEKRNIKN